MTEVTSDLIHESLRNVQGRMDRMENGIGEIRQEVVSTRLTQMGIQNDVHDIYEVLARHEERLERIEHRLELREIAEAKPYDPIP
jgi:chromosome segregation ATPase